MKVEVKDAAKSQKEIVIEIPYESFEQEMESQTSKVAKDAKVPGFRPGKAPKEVVKKQNEHSIRSKALDALINNAIRDALISNNINPISQPQVGNMKMEDGEPISFSVFVEVFPDFSIENISGFSFEKISIKTSDEDVENTLERFRTNFTDWAPVAKKRKAKLGDQAIIDYLGKVDGVPFDGGKAEGHALELGSGQFIPGFEDGVVGMAVEEVKDVTVTFPEQYHSAELAGKDAIFTVTLHEIKEKVEPKLDDELAKKISPVFDTMEKLREAVRKDLMNEADQYVKLETFTSILDKLMEENPFEIPNSIAAEQAHRMAEQNMQQYYQMGIDPKMFGLTPEALAPDLMPEAEKQVKRALIINKLADDNKFDVTPDELKAQIEKAAEMTGRPLEELEKEIYSNQQYVMSMRNDLLSDKVYEFLLGKNKIKETVLTRTEFEEREKAKREARDAEFADEEKPKKKTAKAAKAADDKEKEPAKKAAKKDDADEKPAAKKTAAKKPAAKKDEEKPAAKKPAAKKTTKKSEK